MQPMVVVWSSIALIYFHSVSAERREVQPGVCLVNSPINKTRLFLNRATSSWDLENYTEQKEVSVCCEGYETTSVNPLICTAQCHPPCVNAECMAPNLCVCNKNHKFINNSTSSCFDVCDSCVNGECINDELECTCFPNYKRDPSSMHICDPVCSPACVNATCSAPNSCECFDNFKKHPQHKNVCIPVCKEKCVFGDCTSPDVCTCIKGYMNDKSAPSICIPVCNATCENGDCIAPDTCKCRDGFERHSSDPSHCVPVNTYLVQCKLTMSSAINVVEECFVLKHKFVISEIVECQPLNVLSSNFCSQEKNCDLSWCGMNFRCSMKDKVLNEISCFKETYPFETDEGTKSVIPFHDWENGTIILNFYQQANSSNSRNTTINWQLQTLSKAPVCGKMQFGMKISSCGTNTIKPQQVTNSTQPSNEHWPSQLDSSFMVLINVFLIIGFLLLVGAGFGGFMWARHRKLNDPLNYRGDMNGYYNESFESRSAEIISDDDSAQECDDDQL